MKNILIIALVWPEPNSSAAGAHLLSLIKSLQPIAGKISFGCTSQPSDRSIDLNDINVEAFTIKVNDPEFDNVLAKLNPDLVIFDRYVAEEQFGWRVALNCPKAMRILNTEDLHGLRAARELALKKNEAFDLGHYFNDVAKREVASILRSDMSLIISEFELNWLKTVCHVPETMLVYFPLLINTEAIETSGNLPSFDDRKGYMFIGNFRHQPNVDAIEFLIRDIWPGIREHDNEAELYIFGAYMPKQKSSLQDEDAGIYMKGFAENLESTFQSAKICLAPLRYGAGLKGKLIDAMFYGTPFITTSIGAEGLRLDFPKQVVDDPADFIRYSVKLYYDRELWNESLARGLKHVKQHFEFEGHAKRLVDRILEISDLTNHRQNHFLSAVLWHQSLQSTRYLSKWIEEKNKNKK